MQSDDDLQMLRDLSFDEWVAYVFDHPVTKPEWWWANDFMDWDTTPEQSCTYLTRLCTNPEFLVGRYTSDQLGQGFWFLFSMACGSEFDRASSLEDDAKVIGLIEALVPLYERLFATLCRASLGHKSEGGLLETTVYMAWDGGLECLCPDSATGWARRRVDAVYDTLAAVLRIENECCIESSLHGLGELHDLDPNRSKRVIDDFLAENPSISPELKAYARQARTGCIL